MSPHSSSDFSLELDRYEAKYVISRSLMEPIRQFIKPYCRLDKHAQQAGGNYFINTLQLDNDAYSLHLAKERGAAHRFKLRVRTYGLTTGDAPVFLEIKRRYFDRIIKSRACIAYRDWAPTFFDKRASDFGFKTVKEREAYHEFLRLYREIDAKPKIYVRYNREAYESLHDHYARVTFDTQLAYQPVQDMYDWGQSGKFFSMDSGLLHDQRESNLILEIKCTEQVPVWMTNLVQEFDLIRVGNCKYSNAIWMEDFLHGQTEAPFVEEYD